MGNFFDAHGGSILVQSGAMLTILYTLYQMVSAVLENHAKEERRLAAIEERLKDIKEDLVELADMPERLSRLEAIIREAGIR